MRSLTELPKAHLHLHLEGSARLSTIAELAERDGTELSDLMTFGNPVPTTPPPPQAALRAETHRPQLSRLSEFMVSYSLAVATVTRPEDLERIAYELLVDEAAQGVRWCEPMVTPQNHAPKFGSIDVAWEAMRRGFERAAAETGIGWGVVVGHIRHHPVEVAEQMATWAAAHAGEGVVAFGLAGDEQRVGPEPFARAFGIAAEAELLLVPHAGETVGPESVRGALGLGAHRVAHGIRAVEDPTLLMRLADEAITCDVCPTSNLKLAVVADLAEHPLPRLLEAGVPVTLGSDDQLFFGSNLEGEYAVAREAFGLSDGDLAAIARTSAVSSGAPAALKDAMVADIAAWEAA